MPVGAAIAVGVVGAGATLGSAKMQSNANKRATDAQLHSTDAALGYQKEQDAYARSIEERKWADYQKRHAEWEARRPGGAGGSAQIGPGMGTGAYTGSGFGARMNGIDAVPGMQPAPGGGGASLASLMGGMGGTQPDVSAAPAGMAPADPAAMGAQQQGLSLADLAQWGKHENYFGA